MNPGGFRSLSVTLLLLAVSVVIMAAASVTGFEVSASRNLTIAIVDTQRTTPARNTLRAELAAALKSVVNQTCGTETAIRAVYVGARDAKLKLYGGKYDAALVIGVDRPSGLRRLDLVTLAGSMPATTGLQPVSLVLGNGDPALNERLRAAFTRLISLPPAPYRRAPAATVALASVGN